MTISVDVIQNIEAILFDMNGTLRVRKPHAPTQHAAIKRLLEILGKEDVPDSYWEELARRHKAYSYWAQENLLQLSEAEIWTRWILPDQPRQRIESFAADLTLLWSERKGRAVPKPGAEEMLIELRRRGYRLGMVSNTMSTLDIPRSLKTFAWNDYFDVVILSSALMIRKPAPEPFLEAARALGMEPAQCAYLGNRISRDVVGCKRAGFALGMIIEPPERPRPDEQDQTILPDAVIHSLGELLNLFPARV
jgi:putative hydrolase of the HAD superfamily